MGADKQATATFNPPPPPRTLTVQTAGTGTGAVTGPGINCPGDCTETYADGQQVTLTATPDSGSSFGGWTGDCSGTGACQLTMGADKQATATFNPPPPPRTLTVQTQGTGTGTVTGPGINCPGDCTETYADGQQVTLTATPDSGSSFGGWTGDCSGTGACQLTMGADKQATATFNPPPPPRTLTVQTQGTGSGTVTGPGINCPGDCTETYADGQQVSLTAAPDSGSSFGGWTGDCSGTGPCQLTMDADKQATATFNPSSQGSLSIPIGTGLDDGDENQSGTVRRTNADINLATGSGGSPTTAALRFTGVQIPNSATIVNAKVQFTVHQTGSAATDLVVRGEQADNSAPIGAAAFNISQRPRTTASVAWPVPPWQGVGASGPDQLTPNLASVVQEVVSRPGWAPGNALTVIITGSGRRSAQSFEGGPPPVLSVTYATP